MNDDFRAVRDAASDSIIVGTFAQLLHGITRAGTESAIVSWTRHQVATTRAWTMEERVQGAAVSMIVAGLVNAALLWRANAYASPAFSGRTGIVIAMFAGAVAVAPRPFVNAWSSSLMGRVATSIRRFVYTPAE